jgi:hypothetical protein
MLPGRLPSTLDPVRPEERFWPARLRWRLRGAWLWPAFVLFTLADGVLLHLLPPVRLGFTSEGMTLVFGVIVATFANLVLVGAVAPWLARRLTERPAATASGTLGTVPHQVRRELVLDRVGTALLAAGLLGVLAAGLGSREVVVADTKATETNANLVRAYVQHSHSAELRRNLETANTIKLGTGYFRTCIAHDDRRRAYCFYVDTTKNPTRLTRDPSAEPNAKFRRR